MIAIDWGTTSFRAYRLAANGSVLEKRAAPLGIMQVEGGRFAQALDEQIGDWLRAGEAPVLMSGMIGSRQGWQEVPYVQTPAGTQAIAAGMMRVPLAHGGSAWITPGVTTRDADGVPDVMRGEETQILGVLDALPASGAWVCLPGTHSKWVHVQEGRIRSFSTFMTGEVFAVLKAHSILGRTMSDAPVDMHWFEAGLAAGTGGDLLHRLFGVRARGLFGELSGENAGAYLSGLLIGSELSALPPALECAYLLGSSELTRLYQHALIRRSVRVELLDQDAVVTGLLRLKTELEGLSA